MADALGSYPQFRLNFEQQGKRAKDLLKAARAGEAEALARFKSPPRLAEAQYLIARELRFDNWASMKRHISEMTLAREAMHAGRLNSNAAIAALIANLFRTLGHAVPMSSQAVITEMGWQPAQNWISLPCDACTTASREALERRRFRWSQRVLFQ